MNTVRIAALAAASLLAAAAPAMAAPVPLVSNQTLSLPLGDDPEAPTLKLTVASAVFTGLGMASPGSAFMPGESRAERKTRADQIPIETPQGRALIKFVRLMADDLRTRYATATPLHAANVSVSFSDQLKLDGGKLVGDSLLAGFTLGLGAPATTPMNFLTHIGLTVAVPDQAAQTFSCDTVTPGRLPRTPRPKDPHAGDELERMQDVGYRACLAQIAAAMDGKPAATAIAPATPAPATPAVAPATPAGL